MTLAAFENEAVATRRKILICAKVKPLCREKRRLQVLYVNSAIDNVQSSGCTSLG